MPLPITIPIYGGALLAPAEPSSWLAALPAVPLAGAVLLALAGPALQRRVGPRVVAGLGVAAVVGAFALAAAVVLGQLLPAPPGARVLRQELWPLFDFAGVDVSLGFVLDPLSAVMVLLVTGVGALIHVYAAAYMRGDASLPRFFACLNLFVAAMLVLVLGDGFVPLLFGWEGVGLCSYLLIGYYTRRPAAAEAARKAFVVNRFGDFAMLLGIFLLAWGMGGDFGSGRFRPEKVRRLQVDAPAGGGMELKTRGERSHEASVREIRIGSTLSFRELREQLGIEWGPSGENGYGVNQHGRPIADALAKKRVLGLPLVAVVVLLLFLGAAGKSAQVPLFAWLPDAMAGPTPVSALIHAATMVTAGVYLFARLGFLFVMAPGALLVVALAGTLTAIIGATAAAVQRDLKRVLAYSTVSQLGFMFAAAGAGAFGAAIFHVVTHAFFKACLFLAAGSIIHAVEERSRRAPGAATTGEGAAPPAADPQDLFNMGGLAATLPWTRRAYLVAAIALAGLPLASGFFSKDQILLAVLESPTGPALGRLLYGALVLVSVLTAFYAFRSYYLVFYARPATGSATATAGRAAATSPAHEAPAAMTGVVVLLALGAVVVGPVLGWPRAWTAGHGATVLDTFLAPVFTLCARWLPPQASHAAAEWTVAVVGLVAGLGGWLWARAWFRARAVGPDTAGRRAEDAAARHPVRRFFADGWRFDDLYRLLAIAPARDFARATAWLDRNVWDRLIDGSVRVAWALARLGGLVDRRVVDAAVDGSARLVAAGGRQASRVQTGRIGHYVLGIVVGLAVLTVLTYLLGAH